MASSKQNSSFSPCKQINHNSNSSHFVAVFDCFHNMRSNMELCDVTLTVGNVSFSAHRLVLAGNSPYFRKSFISENADSRHQEVILPNNFRGDTLRSILDYFYTGKVSINHEDCEDFLSLASHLQVCYSFATIHSISFSICKIILFFSRINYLRSRLKSARTLAETNLFRSTAATICWILCYVSVPS